MLDGLSTANFFDACLRAGIAPRCALLQPVIAGRRIAGPVVAVRHFGSVDVFLEAMSDAPPGCVLAIDNAARRDEACIGDLVGIEAKAAGFAGILIWGLHRDTQELREIGLPVYSLGAAPMGPTRLDPREEPVFGHARFGDVAATGTDYAVADDDGAIFFPAARLDELAAAARTIRDVETVQAQLVEKGTRLREQLRLREFVERRAREPGFTFRDHLRNLKASIEE